MLVRAVRQIRPPRMGNDPRRLRDQRNALATPTLSPSSRRGSTVTAPDDARDRFLDSLPEVGQSQWPNRLLMEIECINDPVELEAVKILIDERIAWLKG